MASTSQTGYGAVITNQNFLWKSCSAYRLYNPITEDIKLANYKAFLFELEAATGPLRVAEELEHQAAKKLNALVATMRSRSRTVRDVIAEIYTDGSEVYRHFNPLIDMINGDNNSKASAKRKREREGQPEGEKEKDFVSVSQQDAGSVVNNFETLFSELSTYPEYLPEEEELTVAGLQQLFDETKAAQLALAEKTTNVNTLRSAIQPMLDDATDRAERAKRHVKRKYTMKSIEYKALVNRKY